LSFFTIETAKTDASIQDNLGALRLARPSAVGCTSGKPSAWVIARLIAQWLSKRFGQQFIIENRPGANYQVLIKVGGRELPRQANETQAQILARRATLVSLDTQTSEDEWRAICVMPYMADF
jgi:hypothetical protein